ncbi:glucosaminidase domain-containing protein [Candidatus Enterococcus ferrettii]|uniref:Mannosyl-glycoprotein endo-beta-N-acetylglucosamidase-like domain-containing protein n=1 Tax=Candidatus Enterococcus ferrettii TaxID=2815324 RepID=A0ABV0EK99_9ENTE|nr:glucosaminidase domain-containing protein [Enterococcus sp. 665A]MBO1341396.1 glucosaminidase domain-containing protein [Enterococcus sp. 665A]
MKGKWLLISLGVSIFLLIGNLIPEKQVISAEAKESFASQRETTSQMTSVTAGSSTVQESIESMMTVETSSAGKNQSNELSGAKVTTTSTSESKEAMEKSSGSSSSASEIITEKIPMEKVEKNYQFSVIENLTTKTFIQTIANDAQQIAWQKELYASVMIAQAILETGSGNSRLARPPYHNLFGIKGSYQGKQVSFKTQEDRGNGELYTIQSTFRQYPSYRESLEDYAALLKNGLSSNIGFYQETWKTNAGTYHEAAKALTGKYATDTTYDKKLTALIEAYNLTIYDQDPTKSIEAEQEKIVSDPIELENNSEDKQKVEASNEPVEPAIIVNETTQSAVMIPPTAQRPAKQLYGNRSVQ